MRKNYFLKSMLSLLLMFVGISIGQAKSVTYTITSSTAVSTAGDAPSASSANFVNTYTSNKFQMTSGNSMTLTLSGFDSKKITGLTMYMASNASKGSGSFSMQCGTTTLASIATAAFNDPTWNGAWSGSPAYVNINPAVTSYTVNTGEQVKIIISASVNSLWCQSFTLTYEDSAVDTRTKTTTVFGDGSITSVNAFIGESFTAPTATVDNSETVTYSSSATNVAIVNPVTGAVFFVAPGSTTITASYAGDATYAPSSASYTLNVGNVYNNIQELQAGATSTSTLAKITFNNVIVTGIKNTSNAYISDGQYGAMIYTSGHGLTAGKVLNGTIVAKVQLYGGATEITNFSSTGLTITDGTLTPKVTTISALTLSDQSNYVQLLGLTYDATAKTFTDATGTMAFYDGLTTGMTLVDGAKYNITGVVGYYNKLQIFPAVVEALPTDVAITAAQYATYVAPFDINISKSNVEAYTVSLLNGTYAVLTPVTLIPKGSVVLLKGTEGTHALYSDATQIYTALTDNLLVASSTDVIADGSQYVLAMPSGSPVGFYRANPSTTIYAGKGYLSIPLPPPAKFLGFTFDTTGIDKVNASTENNVIYNLNGQKISAPVKGVNIINGKKVVVK